MTRQSTTTKTRTLLAAAGFVGVVIAANALTNTFGLIEWMGLTATAGTWVAGFALVFRDALQDAGGRRWVIAAILVGAAVSAILSPALALASAVAFTLSELADFAIYTPLRRRHRLAAQILSNTVGAGVDTILFLAIAGFPLNGTVTQVVIKVATTTVVVLVWRGARDLHGKSGQ